MKRTLGVFTVMAILSFQTTASAQSPDYQFNAPVSAVPDPDNICDFRTKIGLSTTYDSANDIYTVTMDPFASGANKIPGIQVPSHDGVYPSFADMDDYFAELIGGFSCANPPEFPRPSMCNPGNIRFDIRTPIFWMDGATVLNQDRHPFWGLLTNEFGVMETVLEQLQNTWQIQDEQCSYGSDSGFEVQQCSEVRTITNYVVEEKMCGELGIRHPTDVLEARNYFNYFKYQGVTTSIEDIGGGWLNISWILADQASLDREFFLNNTPEEALNQTRSTTPPIGYGIQERNGTCAAGQVTRGVADVVLQTDAGFSGSCTFL